MQTRGKIRFLIWRRSNEEQNSQKGQQSSERDIAGIHFPGYHYELQTFSSDGNEQEQVQVNSPLKEDRKYPCKTAPAESAITKALYGK